MSDHSDPVDAEDSAGPPRSDGQSYVSRPGSDGPEHSRSSRSDERAAERDEARRAAGLDAVSLAALLLPLPWYVWSVGIVYWTGTLFVDTPWARTILGVWLLSGIAMLWLPFEEIVAKSTFRLRRPIRAESEKLDAASAAAADGAYIDRAGYSLWVEDSDGVSASALAGRVVGVTRKSLTLPTNRLRAALAHEMGHHPDGYGLFQAVGLWYSLPARVWIWVIRNFGRITRGLPLVGCLVAGFVLLSLLGIILNALIFSGFPFALFEVALLFLAPLILAWFDRLAEKNADRVAAGRGHGPALLELLNELHAENYDADRRDRGRSGTVLSSQAGVADRIRSLERYLGQKAG